MNTCTIFPIFVYCLTLQKKTQKRNKTKQNIVNVSLQDNRITGKKLLVFSK